MGKRGSNFKPGGEVRLLCLGLGSLVFSDGRQAGSLLSRGSLVPCYAEGTGERGLRMGCELGTGWVSRPLSLGQKGRGWEVPWPADAGDVGARGLGLGASAGTRVQDREQVGGLGPRGKGAPGKQQAPLGSGGVSLCLSAEH